MLLINVNIEMFEIVFLDGLYSYKYYYINYKYNPINKYNKNVLRVYGLRIVCINNCQKYRLVIYILYYYLTSLLIYLLIHMY